MSDSESTGTPGQRLAAYAAIGALIGLVAVWFVVDGFSAGAIGSGLIGGAIAGAIAGLVRMKLGLDS